MIPKIDLVEPIAEEEFFSRNSIATGSPWLASNESARPPARNNRVLAVAKCALEELIRLHNDAGADAAHSLFNISDRIDRAEPDRNDGPGRRCANAVLQLARAITLDPSDVREPMWIAVIDAAQEWVWVLE